MKTERVKEIFQSKDTFAVNLGGESVWIEEVDEASGMATVQIGSDPQRTATVAIDQLQEVE